MMRTTLAALMCAGTLTAASAEPLVLNYGWMGPATEPTYVQSMVPFAEAVTADSEGTIKIEMYPGGTMGRDPAGQVQYLQQGVLDISF